MRRATTALFVIALGLLILSDVSGVLGRWFWAFEMASNLRLGYVIVGGLVLLAALVLRRFAVAALVVIALVPHGWAMRGHLPQVQAEGGISFRVLTANLFWINQQPAAAIDWLAAQDVDLVVLQESDPRWDRHLGPLRATFAYSVPDSAAAALDVMVFSRHPVEAVVPFRPERPFITGMQVTVTVGDRPVTILAVHTTSPFTRLHAGARDRQLTQIAALARNGADRPVIALGDFNVTPYSPAFDILREAGLSGGASSGTPLATWPSWLPLIGLPIDHVLGNAQVAIDRVESGPDIGSDHYPVIARLRILDRP